MECLVQNSSALRGFVTQSPCELPGKLIVLAGTLTCTAGSAGGCRPVINDTSLRNYRKDGTDALPGSPLRQNSCRLLTIGSWGGDKGQKWQGTDRNSWTEQ